jgi:SAM-dependent methyltransferase
MARRGFVKKEENLPVRFSEGDARNLPYPSDTFDFVMIVGNSFGYFDNPNTVRFYLTLRMGITFQKITKRCPGNG